MMPFIPAWGFAKGILDIPGNDAVSIEHIKKMRGRLKEFIQCHTHGAIINWGLLHATVGCILEIDKLTDDPQPSHLEETYAEIINLLIHHQY